MIDCILPSAYADIDEDKLLPIIDFPTKVINEDGEMCELNQKGLHSMRHEHGMLVEQ